MSVPSERNLWISLDIETHGAVERDSKGGLSPTQMEKKGNGRFHPAKSIHFDNPRELVVTCSITLLRSTEKDLSISVKSLTTIEILETRVFLMHRKDHCSWLVKWLDRAAVVLGHNVQFDVMYLRAQSEELSQALGGQQVLIDTGILSYMESEVREEKSLKQLSPLMNRLNYDDTASNKRFKDPEDPDLIRYNALDTEYTAQLAKTVCRRIVRKYPGSKKLEEDALKFYSEDLWTCIAKSEVGVPMDTHELYRLHCNLEKKIEVMERIIYQASENLGCVLQLTGPGSDLSKQEFVYKVIEQCDLSGVEPPILMNDRLGKTKGGKFKWDKGNRALFLEYLSETKYGAILRLVNQHEKMSKLRNSYTQSLLYHNSNKKDHRNSKLIPEYTWRQSRPSGNEVPPFIPTSYDSALTQMSNESQKNCSTSITLSEDCTPNQSTESSSCSPPMSTAGTNSSKRSAKRAQKSKSSRKSNPSGTHPYWSGLTVRSKRKIRREHAEWKSSLSSESSSGSPPKSRVLIAYPHWYPVPQYVTDADQDVGGTEQGRTTAKQPALQTLPYIIKKMACSRFEDGHFLAYDLSQIEVRIATVSSGEPAMLAEYQKEKPDLHAQMAMVIWGDDVVNTEGWKSGDNTKDRRQWAKEPNFLIQYWGGAFSLYTRLSAKGVPVTLEECEEIIRKVVAARPVLRAWQEELLNIAARDGYVTACPIYGTTRTMIGDVYGGLRSTVVNCPIQTRAGHTLRAIEHRLFRQMDSLHTIRSLKGRKHMLSQQVYDAIYIDSRDPEEARGLVMDATKWVEQHGYYARLCEYTGHFVPLVMEDA